MIFRLFWRGRTNPQYRQRISERLGFVKSDTDKPIIWIHAVSVGEANAAKPLIDGLIAQYPNHRILVTTTTPTGSDRVKALFGNHVVHVYFPYDLPEIIYRFLNRIEPKALIIVETEIWPNLYAACNKRKIPVFLVNARLSDKSAKGYQKIKGLVSETLRNTTKIAVRSEQDRLHFESLGAGTKSVDVVGNIKFDFDVDDSFSKKGRVWKKQWGEERLIWVAASTHAGEDEKLLAIHQQLLNIFPELLLVLVPRHPERFDEVFNLCNDFDAVRHSLVVTSKDGYAGFKGQVILGDSMGEMQSWFAIADVVFIGGSLIEVGGHNPLEAIAHGKPVVSGEYMFNFSDLTPELLSEGLLFSCKSEKDIEDKIKELLELPKNSFTDKTKAIMQKNKGVAARLLAIFDTEVLK